MLLLGWSVVRQNEKLVKKSVGNVIEMYGEELDTNFYTISEYVIDFLMNDKNINGSLAKEEVEGVKDKIESINAQKELLGSFEMLNNNFGEEFHFWYYNTKNGVFLQSGEGQVREKRMFKMFFTSTVEEERIELPNTHEWTVFSEDGFHYAMTICENEGVYTGCYVMLDSIIDSLEQYINDGGILILDKYGEVVLEYSASEKVNASYGQEYMLENGDFSIRFLDGGDMKRQISMIWAAFLTVVVVCIGVTIFLAHYTKRSILLPILYFTKCVENYKSTGTFGGDYIYEEFEDAARLLNTLEREISHLKIQIYEEQIEKKKVELDYAQLQIRPHFYINCLNNVYSMIQIEKKKEAQSLIIYVSNYLRSIFRKGIELVSMKEELENIRNFLEIHKILYRNGCGYELRVEDDLEKSKIPPLLIQTFVENCIKHTLDLERYVTVQIYISCCCENRNNMQIIICDNGTGFPRDYLEEKRKNIENGRDSRFQIGLDNVKDRLRLLYGNKANILLKNQESGGAYVRIELPIIWEEENEFVVSG